MLNKHFKLTPDEQDKFFKKITELYFKNTTRVEQPTFFLVGGQSGAGKSGLTALVQNKIGNNSVVLDADAIRPYHLHFKKMIKQDPKKVFEWAREDVNILLKKTGQWAVENGRNIIMDGTLREKDHIAQGVQDCKKMAIGHH